MSLYIIKKNAYVVHESVTMTVCACKKELCKTAEKCLTFFKAVQWAWIDVFVELILSPGPYV